MAENKNKDYDTHSRVYLWHRFEQSEADCYLKWLSPSGRATSLKLLTYLVNVGTIAKTLTDKDISDMNEIIQGISKTMPEIVLDES